MDGFKLPVIIKNKVVLLTWEGNFLLLLLLLLLVVVIVVVVRVTACFLPGQMCGGEGGGA